MNTIFTDCAIRSKPEMTNACVRQKKLRLDHGPMINVDALADAWIAFHRAPKQQRDGLFWAWETLDTLVDRDPETVAYDVRQGYITKDSAERHYGIVFRDGTLDLNIVATQARREDMRAQGLPVDDPEPSEKIGDGHAHDHHHHHNHHQDLTEEERLVIAMSGRCCA